MSARGPGGRHESGGGVVSATPFASLAVRPTHGAGVIRGIAAAGVLWLAAGGLFLAPWLGLAAVGAWLGASLVAVAWVTLVVARMAKESTMAPRETVVPRLGLANRITLGRALLLAPLAGFAVVPRLPSVLAWLPAALYALNVLGDGIDGYLARVTRSTTSFGARLDTAFDALGLLLAPLVAVRLEKLPPWYLALGSAYYVMVGALAVARVCGRPVHPERNVPNRHRRLFAGLHMLLVVAALAPGSSPAALAPVAAMWTVPVVLDLAVTTCLMLGCFDFDGAYAQVMKAVRAAGLAWLPFTARLIAGVALLGAGAPVALQVAGAALVAGVAARSAAAVAVIGVVFGAAGSLSESTALVAGGGAVVLFAGSGTLSLWRPEDGLLLRRLGERP